ncbi:hypothetical protein, partial [Escherichia coli]|uniref:hypothetical protein n=1 Tax=Escherichia coli TaxID=562 RepID=UPI000A7D125C
ICSPMTSLKTSIKTITYLSDTGCLEIQGASLHPFMSKGALYEFNNPDQLKIPLPHKHIASTFNDIMSKDVGYAYVSLLYACPLKTHSLRLNPFSK